MAIYVGTGSDYKQCVPIVGWHGKPFIYPIVMGTGSGLTSLYPDQGGIICTYGANLFTSDYKGKIEDWSNLPYNGGNTISGSATYTSTTSNGMSVALMDSGRTGSALFYPTFSSEDSSKQKLRGALYTAYDDYLRVRVANHSLDDAWPTGSTVSSNRMIGYEIDSSNTDIYLEDGWVLFKGSAPYGIYIGIDVVWNTAIKSTPFYKNSASNGMFMTSNYTTGHDTTKWFDSTIATPTMKRYNISIDGTAYILARLLPTSIGHGKLLISPPKFMTSVGASASASIEMVQFGLTFGTTPVT